MTCRERPSPANYFWSTIVLAVSLNFRKFFEFRVNAGLDDFETTSVMEQPIYIVISNVWQELLVTGLLPFVALVYCNVR